MPAGGEGEGGGVAPPPDNQHSVWVTEPTYSISFNWQKMENIEKVNSVVVTGILVCSI